MRNKRFGLSEWQRHKVKENIKGGARFVLTVAVSCGVTVWMEHRHPSQVVAALEYVSHAPRKIMSFPTHPARAYSPGHLKNLGDHYSHYLDEALPLLRSDATVRMVKIQVPNSLLEFQQGAKADGEAPLLRLHSSQAIIPALAVSRNAKEFLIAMRITYIDPDGLPEDLLPVVPILAKDWAKNYLIVPDSSGAQGRIFVYSKK